MSRKRCEYCGQEERYGHNAICVMNVVHELRAEIARLRAEAVLLRREIVLMRTLVYQHEDAALKDTTP